MPSAEQKKAWAEVTRLARAHKEAPALGSREVLAVDAPLVHLDYTRSLVDAPSVAALERLAAAYALDARFAAMAAGAPLNVTEGRAVEHVELRAARPRDEIAAELGRMRAFAAKLHAGEVAGATGRPISSLLHLGIGGSYLGPRLLYEALAHDALECRFVANVDPAALRDAIAGLDPATTLIVSASKSGSTAETLANARTALAWIDASLGAGAGKEQLAVVSANPEGGAKLSCPAERCFALWDSIGGRYSVWSAVSLAVAAACGPGSFDKFLAGARQMDAHVLASSGLANIAVALALLQVFHAKALKSQTHCVISYQHRLRSLPAYLQQLVMESNGKSVTARGGRVFQDTSPIWWGGEGTNDQHSYFQLLLQGRQPAPCDFIYARRAARGEDPAMHASLVAHCIGQSRALFAGIDASACEASLVAGGMAVKEAARLAPHQAVKGGQPVNLVSIESLTPAAVGALLAMYEHMTAALGWLWEINSFDQWGVEYGKVNFRKVQAALERGEPGDFEPATRAALARQQAKG